MRLHDRLFVGSIAAGAVLFFGLAAGAVTGDAPSPADKLNIWEGRWKLHEEIKETPYSHAGAVTLDGKCSWLPNHTYMVCDFLTEGPDPERGGAVANNLSLFYYSDADHAYKHTGMGTEGGPHEQVATVDGGVWTTEFQITGRKGDKLLYRNVYDFVSVGEYKMQFEISADNGQHWTVLHDDDARKMD